MSFKRAVAAGIVMLLTICVATGWYLYNKPHATIKNIEPDVRITATDLYNQYQENEAAANKKYVNQIIEVTGNISGIEKVSGSVIIQLNSAEAVGGVSCKLSDTSNINQNGAMKKSKTITIKGKCTGFLMDVNLVDCVIK